MAQKKRQAYKTFLLVIVTAMFASLSFVHAQTIHGYLLDSATRSPISNASVSNKTKNKTVVTGENGFFTVDAKDFDLIFFTALGYRLKTFYYDISNKDTMRVFLAPLPIELPGVTVRTKGYNQYQLDSIDRKKEFVKDAGPKMKAVSSANSGAGIGLNLDALFKKKERNRRQAYGSFDDNEEDAYVAYRFSIDLVKEYTGLQGDSLLDFMYKYTPKYKWLRKHGSDEDVIYYINDKLKEFYGRAKKGKK